MSVFPFDKDTVFALVSHVAVEYFETGALLFDLRSRTFIELDSVQAWIASHSNGERTVAQVLGECAATFALTDDQAIETVMATCEKLLETQSLRLVRGTWEGDTMDGARYVQNPDVNLREEDEDGALLFNPDNDRVQLLNATGLYIWKLCAQRRTRDEIIVALKTDFEDAPEDAVATDVEEFMNQMIDSGFLGTLQTS